MPHISSDQFSDLKIDEIFPLEEQIVLVIRDHHDKGPMSASILADALRLRDWPSAKILLSMASNTRLYTEGFSQEDHLLEILMLEGLEHPEAQELAITVAKQAPLDFLLQHQSKTGNTPAHLASWYGYDDIIAIYRARLALTESPAPKNPGLLTNNFGETPLLFAMVALQADVVDVLHATHPFFPEPDPFLCMLYGAAAITGLRHYTALSDTKAELEALQDDYFRIMEHWTASCGNRFYEALEPTVRQCFEIDHEGTLWQIDTTSIESFVTLA